MTIFPIQIKYEWQHKLLDTGFPYVTIPVLNNSKDTTGTTFTFTNAAGPTAIADVFTGGLAEIYIHIWVNSISFTGGATPHLTIQVEDLNQATYSAQLAGLTTTAAQEAGTSLTVVNTPVLDPTSAVNLDPGPSSVVIRHTSNSVSDITRIVYSIAGGPTTVTVTNMFIYVVGKPFQRGA